MFTKDLLKEQLAHFLECNHLSLNETQRTQLTTYLLLVQEWNQKINITGHKNWEDLILKDIIDNLYIDQLIKKHELSWNSLIDLGCGAGFSGIILAIMQPGKKVAFLDSSRKKINFVRHACRELNLPNTQFFQQRVEEGIHMRVNESDDIDKGSRDRLPCLRSLPETNEAGRHALKPIEKATSNYEIPKCTFFDLAISRATWGFADSINYVHNYVHNKGHGLYACGPNQLINLNKEKNTPFFSLFFDEFYIIKPKNYKRHLIAFKRLK